MARQALILLLLGSTVIPPWSSAEAAITLTSDANDLAQGIEQVPQPVITGASFVSIPPAGTPHGVSDTPLAGFPTAGSTFTILTTGNAAFADDPNSSGSTSADDSGGPVRGNTDLDVSVLRIDLDIPEAANCLSIDFRFLSEEYPEYVGTGFNDAFIAELDASTWTTSGSTITAPENFAFDPVGNVISINAAGATSMSAGEAAGTTYDGATPVLTASTPTTSGAHSLFLSIFDQGDRILDSAVFLDSIVVGRTDPEGCQPGATVLTTEKSTATPVVEPGGLVEYTIVVENPGILAETLETITDSLPSGFSYIAGSTTGVTTSDPGVSGQDLVWVGPFNLPAQSSVALSFNATAALVPADYLNNAGGAATGIPVTPSGPTAQVTVEPSCSEFPPAGFDTFETRAVVTVQISESLTDIVELSGPTVIERGDPLDPGDGRREIPTEIVSMNLTGTSPVLGALTLIESPTLASTGTIKAQSTGSDFPADSFFNVYFEIETMVGPLHNASDDPLLMRQVINCIPPLGAIYQPPPGVQTIYLLNADGNAVATLVHAQHEVVSAFCGDGTEHPWEDCDDNNVIDCDGCDRNCTLTACGNAIICQPEECDDGNQNSGDGCRSDCTPEECGDGILDPQEACEVTDDTACPGECEPPGELNECTCPPSLEHYKCYKAKETKKRCLGNPDVKCTPPDKICEDQGTTGPCLGFQKGVSVDLKDQLEEMSFEVKKPKGICTPARKNGEEPVPDLSGTHLKAYLIKRPKGNKHDRQRVLVQDQYGDHVLETLKDNRLLVPTSKVKGGPVGSVPTDVHHFKCYKVKEVKKVCTGDLQSKCSDKPGKACSDLDPPVAGECYLGLGKGVKVNLEDQFETKEFDIKKPRLLCTPVQKGDEPAPDLEGPHLVGYQIKTMKGGSKHEKQLELYVNNQFGEEILETIKEEFLLVPALKTPATVTTTTTSATSTSTTSASATTSTSGNTITTSTTVITTTSTTVL